MDKCKFTIRNSNFSVFLQSENNYFDLKNQSLHNGFLPPCCFEEFLHLQKYDLQAGIEKKKIENTVNRTVAVL